MSAPSSMNPGGKLHKIKQRLFRGAAKLLYGNNELSPSPAADELAEALGEAQNGEAPSPFGRARFVVRGKPASVQSSKAAREVYIESIKRQFTELKYILTGELILNVTWFLPAKSRFETDAKADIDNCIKPIIDAFTGADGLFIDDCQIRGLYICWQNIISQEEHLVFDFEFVADDYSLKSDLVFIRLEKGLCTPANINWPRPVREVWARMLKANENMKDELEELTGNYLAVAGVLGNSTPFHITRVAKKFRIVELKEFVEGN